MATGNGIRVAIVGGGLAGLAAAMKIAEGGHSVELFSVVPVKRSHSVCAQGGINAEFAFIWKGGLLRGILY